MNSKFQMGFTLLEMLIVLAIVGILLAVGVVNITRWRDKAQAENFVQGFAADMNRYRMLGVSTATPYRLRLTDSSSYVVERGTLSAAARVYGDCSKLMTSDPNVSSVSTVLSRSEPAVTIGLTGATIFQFDSRGNLCAFTSGGAATQATNLSMVMTKVGVTRSVIVTALGLAKAVQ